MCGCLPPLSICLCCPALTKWKSASSFFLCVFVFWDLPTDYGGRVLASGSVVKDWLSSQWCQRRREPRQCRPLDQSLTASCLCWKSACKAWKWTDPRPRPTQREGNSGRTCGMLGNEIRWDLGLDHGNLSRFMDVKSLGSLFHFFYPTLFISDFQHWCVLFFFRTLMELHMRDEKMPDMVQCVWLNLNVGRYRSWEQQNTIIVIECHTAFDALNFPFFILLLYANCKFLSVTEKTKTCIW